MSPVIADVSEDTTFPIDAQMRILGGTVHLVPRHGMFRPWTHVS